MEKHIFEFTDQDMQVIVAGLGKLPLEFAVQTFMSVNQQVAAHRAPKPAQEILPEQNIAPAPSGV